jgi:CRISPR-associated protein Csh2/CRISPR-associated protein Csd2
MLNKKIDFIMTIVVNNANPNGDPLAGNMPRTDSKGFGEMSDVSIKRKIRNRMQDMGHEIFVKSRDRTDDGFNSLEARYKSQFDKKFTDIEVELGFNKNWMDVRTFGQVITFDKRSIGIRGPVSISMAKSLDPVEITSMQITRSTNGMEPKSGSSRSSDTMGSKHVVEFGTYIVNGAVNCFYSEKTGFDDEDLEVLKEALKTLFVNDASSARPDGSMEIKDIYWFEHSSKTGDVSSAKIKDLLVWDDTDSQKTKYEDYNIKLDQEILKEYQEKGLNVEHIEGL